MRTCACFAIKPGGCSILRGGASLVRCLLFFLRRMKPFWVYCAYFWILSTLGFLALKVSKPRAGGKSPEDLDLFFTSVSAVTVSSMATVEMEVFSNSQLMIITLLMLLGGEVFTSMLSLHFFRPKLPKKRVDSVDNTNKLSAPSKASDADLESNNSTDKNGDPKDADAPIKDDALRCLGYLVLWYILVVHVAGSFLVFIYIVLIPSARHLINSRGISIQTFSLFLTVSTFGNCGFAPTNENMMAFRQNSGLLLILIPQILLGNTLFAPCLRLVVTALEKTTNRPEFAYLLKDHKEIRYPHLLSRKRCGLLALTASAFLLLQLVTFCATEWSSESLQGLSPYQKLVGSLFQVVNSRHAGESVVDLSVVSPAMLVLFIAMMYLPAYTSFSPSKCQVRKPLEVKQTFGTVKNRNISSYVLFSQLAYLLIFIIILCITEKRKIKEDPVNFSILNITFEVMSAYGNVGFSTGYSCKRRIDRRGFCEDKLYGFVGRWSRGGKFILILVMLFGRLKKFSFNKGKAWKLS